MEDSLENYLRLSSNTTKKNNKNDQQEKIKSTLITLQKKKESEARAMKIVEFMIEGRLRTETFFHCLLHLNQEYYQDIVEERALNKICGYAVCSEKIPEMPKKQFHISFKVNKVYDITDRKNYCSNFCYKASLHIKKQIETSPLWLRSYDKFPDFKILPSGSGGLPGEEVDQGIAKPVNDAEFTSVSSFTEASLDELTENEVPATKKFAKLSSSLKMSPIAELEVETLPQNKDKEEKVNSNEDKVLKSFKMNQNANETDKAEENVPSSNSKISVVKRRSSLFSEKSKLQKLSNSSISEKNSPSKNAISVLEHISKCFSDWATIETLIFLHGKEKLRQVLNEEHLNTLLSSFKLAEDKTQQQQKYLELCRKLNMKELADNKFDHAVIVKELKPLPDYEKLKNEGKVMDLKVKSFLQGFPYDIEGEDNNDSNKEVQKKGENLEGEPSVAVLPLVDINSQNALRRKVFLNSLSKVLQNFAELLHFSMYNVQSDVAGFIKTFKLRADNVVFKPLLWNIIGIIILRLLSIKNEYLKQIIDSSTSQHHIKQILKPFTKNEDYVDKIISQYNDLHSFVERYLK